MTLPGFETLTDAELLEHTARASEAFAIFYRRHVGAVIAYFRRRTGDAELALDLAAETFARALEGASRFQSRGEPAAAWLYAIARNLLTDSYRRERVEDDARRRLAMQPLTLTDEGFAAVEALCDAQQRLGAIELDGELSAEQADALRARVLDERSYDDIAAELECSPQVLRQRVSRGLRALRRHLEGGSRDD